MEKKGQFLILSGFFILLLTIFIYSLETDNTYIVNLRDSNLVDNIELETCNILKISNGTQIEQRISNITNFVSIYCYQRDIICNLNIINNTQIPPSGNYSLLNYTHYNLTLEILQSTKNYNSQFNC